MNKIANFIVFQVCWMAAVWGAAQQMGWLGPLCAATFLIVESALSPSGKKLAILALAAAVIGFALDSVYTQAGLIAFASPGPAPSLAPAWIVALWVSFALTLPSSLAYLSPHPWWSAVLGAVGGPIAYWIAIRVWDAGAFTGDEVVVTLVIAAIWAFATPLLFRITDWCLKPNAVADGVAP